MLRGLLEKEQFYKEDQVSQDPPAQLEFALGFSNIHSLRGSTWEWTLFVIAVTFHWKWLHPIVTQGR